MLLAMLSDFSSETTATHAQTLKSFVIAFGEF